MTILKQNWRELITMSVTLLVVSLVVVMGAYVSMANANIGGFPPGAKTSVATTTPAVMTPGTGTSTVVYDAYNLNGTNEPTTGVVTDTDSATLLVQFLASSTASKLKIEYEYSQDGIDWYQDGVSNTFASSTDGSININLPNSFTWTFASTSLDGLPVSATNNLSTEIVPVVTATRYVRAVISDSGTTNAEVWAQFVPKKQQP